MSDADSEKDYEFTNPSGEGTVGLMFLEKLVLAIIDAQPVEKGEKRTRDLRLREAMHALSPPYYRHNKHDKDDRYVLLWMASQEFKKSHHIGVLKPGPSLFHESEKPVEFSSIRELAAKAVDHFEMRNSTKRSIVDRLSKSYSEKADNLRLELIYASANPHVFEHGLLTKIAKLAKLADLEMKLPAVPTAFF